MDNPDLVVACVVGDGEAETGPTATAWHAFKYIDPAESGAVLPIVHVNGFKISERTIYGTMDNKEMTALFTYAILSRSTTLSNIFFCSGYGYQVRIIEDVPNIDNDLAASMEWALAEIKKIQAAARSGKPIVKPRWPVLILRTPKGLGGPKEYNGELIEGSFHSHQVPFPGAKTSAGELAGLQTWLKSYRPNELFTAEGVPVPEVLSIIPQAAEKRLGQKAESYKAFQPLQVPEWSQFCVKQGTQESCMKAIGRLLKVVVKECVLLYSFSACSLLTFRSRNPTSFRIFSPDELVSNKLDAVLEDSSRNFQWDIESRGKGGRVIEILSEHTCQGMLQGYTLTGRTGISLPFFILLVVTSSVRPFPELRSFPWCVYTRTFCYAQAEHHSGIVHTMMVQYSKFTKMVRPRTIIYNTHRLTKCLHSRLRFRGAHPVDRSTTSKRPPGPGKSTTGSPTRIRPSSAQSSTSNPSWLVYICPPMPTASSRR